MRELEVSRRTVPRDLDFLLDEENAPIAYDNARHGYHLTDDTYTLPPMRLSRREVFSFAIARKLLASFEGTPLEMDMRSILDKIADSLEGHISLGLGGLTDCFSVLADDHARVDPVVWQTAAQHVEEARVIEMDYEKFNGDRGRYCLEPWEYKGTDKLLARRGRGKSHGRLNAKFAGHAGQIKPQGRNVSRLGTPSDARRRWASQGVSSHK